LVDRINRRIGYRLQVVRAVWNETARPGDRVTFRIRWRNAGVAPCYGGGRQAIALKDDTGAITVTAVDTEFNVRSLGVGRPAEKAPTRDTEVTVTLPAKLKEGAYRVYISVGKEDGRPVIALPHDNDDGQRRYLLGELKVATK